MRATHHTIRCAVSALALVVGASALGACGEGGESAPSAPPRDPRSRLPGGETTNELLLGRNAFIRPAQNITPDHEPMFYTGNSFFNLAWVQAPASTEARDGLGPLFNARSCSGCHIRDGRGLTPDGPDGAGALGLLIRLSAPGQGAGGAPEPDRSMASSSSRSRCQGSRLRRT